MLSKKNWQNCVEKLKAELSSQQFNTWIRPLQPADNEEGLVLLAPNRFILSWVRGKFLRRISDIISQSGDYTGGSVNLKVHNEQVGSSRFKSPAQEALNAVQQKFEKLRASRVVGISNRIEGFGPLEPVFKARYDAEFSSDSKLSEVQEAPLKYSAPKKCKNTIKKNTQSRASSGMGRNSTLNQNFSFDNFVEGKSNQLAVAAARQVADNVGTAYNPLFLYGGVGLGKTHLMHAVGNHLTRQDAQVKVVYLHSERFVADMVKALQMNAINDFKRYYRSVDALLIDDIQFFTGKERSQEEFFYTFNALFEGGQQIVLTCDRYPKELSGLEERLKSRFGWGLTVAVEPPELETRVAILIKKAEQSGILLPHDAAFFIAQKIRSNVRELEGALKRVVASANFTGKKISIELIKESLKDLLAIQDKMISIENIQKIVSEYYKIKVSDLLSKRKLRSITRPRQLAMSIAKELTSRSLPEIGNAFGGRDHTTVLHACRKVAELVQSDRKIAEDLKNIKRSLTT